MLFRVVSLSFFLATTLHAGWKKIPATEFPMKPPPAPGSAEYKRDFKVLHQLQDSRTAEDCKLALEQEHTSFNVFFADVPGLLSAREASTVEPFITEVLDYAESISDTYKKKFKRVRPYNTDPTIKPCIVGPTSNKSYPSAHATISATGACVLGELFPNRADKFYQRGKQSGDLRVLVGVHHPSDVEAGQWLAKRICERLQEDSDFKEKLEKVESRL